jgi:hypothetical protein
MHRVLTISTLAAAIAAFGIVTPASAKRGHAARVVTVTEHAATDATTDTGATGDSAGDILTFAHELYDEKNAKLVGSDNGWCIRTVPGKAWECTWIASFALGQITVEGAFLDAGDSVLAITGGTGKYSNARGEMKLHARDAKGSEYDFVYVVK